MQLSERTSGKGNRYMSGWLGKASVVAFAGEPDKHGNPTWDLFVSTPEPRPEAENRNLRNSDRGGRTVPNLGSSDPGGRQLPKSGSPDPGDAAKPSASPVARGDGWRGSRYVRLANGARRAPAADGGAVPDDTLEDLYR